jgi:uncharacterized protein (DUF433 family)
MVESKDKVRVTVIKPGEPVPPPVDLESIFREGPFFEGTDVPVQYVFEYVDGGYNLHTLIKFFPSVSMEQALAALDARTKAKGVVHSNRQIVSGTPVFTGTRVPVRNLFDYLAGGHGLDEFLCGFPSVSREQAVSALQIARESLESIAYETASR